MFTGISIYCVMVALIFWVYCGYIWLLFFFYVLMPNRCRLDRETLARPKMALLVPCHNEASLIENKVANIRALDYPADKLLVYFLDGESTDGTVALLRGLVADAPHWQVVETGVTGKINQLNVGLALMPGDVEVVVNTDADTMLAPDVLLQFAAAFASDPRVAVVGANISPGGCLDIEHAYWEGQNTIRILESAVYASSIVVAPCYAFRAGLLEAFPRDCVADDLHVAFRANTEGGLTRYLCGAKGVETRTPDSLETFLNHKFRKGNAFLQELLRFLYMLPSMTPWWKVIYLTKLLQLAIVPWILPYFILSTLSFLLTGGGLLRVAVFSWAVLFLCAVVSSLALNRFKKVALNGGRKVHRGILIPFMFANLVLVLVGLSYPFYRQNSNYNRLG
jgi:cellulose synthase/poly-beta-1,6-N-acetylglucosamine synthase-like glycosyltransferase